MATDINRSIKCRVNSCKHHDSSEFCKLNDIVVGAEKRACCDACETQCESFET